ncbi:hypothetical protein [Photobacterium damselae]|uniref:hypothetical protein n=1 Tax=Photobacterium damselae TaxID=38293 RepID=UPI001F28F274|nr:hypothetical protein [Photobacterium damselae]UKA04529.1 hypothetical protein IHC89_23185 [Photobacterium damselae subsp. damselae]
MIFGVSDIHRAVLRAQPHDTFQPFGLSLKATYGEEADGDFDWEYNEVCYREGETRCHCVVTRILRAICKETKLSSLTLENIVNTLITKDELSVGYMVVHENVYQNIVSDYLITGCNIESLNAFYEKPESVMSLEHADFRIKQSITKSLKEDGATNSQEMREFFTAQAEEAHGSDIAISYFADIYQPANSIFRHSSLVFRALSTKETSVINNAAELLAFCKFMALHNLPMVKTQTTRLVSSDNHIQLYKKMTKWCQNMQ